MPKAWNDIYLNHQTIYSTFWSCPICRITIVWLKESKKKNKKTLKMHCSTLGRAPAVASTRTMLPPSSHSPATLSLPWTSASLQPLDPPQAIHTTWRSRSMTRRRRRRSRMRWRTLWCKGMEELHDKTNTPFAQLSEQPYENTLVGYFISAGLRSLLDLFCIKCSGRLGC